MRLDYYKKPQAQYSELIECATGLTLTEKTFKLAKKKNAFYLLKYFSKHYDDYGKEAVRVTIPPAFEGHILQQLNELYNLEA
jgi:hypothetical protein